MYITTAELIAAGKYYKAKCLECRKTAVGGPTPNEAILAIEHHPSCTFLKGLQTRHDYIDLRVTEEF